MNLWNFKFDWNLNTGHTSGFTWEKIDRLDTYNDNILFDNLNDIYFKYQTCSISGVTYQYVLDVKDIYKRDPMVGSSYYNRLLYNEQDIINEFMINFNYVDYYISNNIDISEKIIKINDKYLKSTDRIILINQTDKIENGVYSFDINSDLVKTDDLDLSGKTYRYGVHVKSDDYVEFFLKNSGDTFPLSVDEKEFITGHTFIIKHAFYYNINNTGTTSDSVPKLWFTDYDFARKLNNENYSLINDINLVTEPSNTISIQYHNNLPVVFDITQSGSTYTGGTFTWNQYTGKTSLNLSDSYASECGSGDYLDIIVSGQTYGIFKSIVHGTNGNTIILDEYIPDNILSGMTNIEITNINKLDFNDWEHSFDLLNRHYYNKFIYFSGTTYPLVIKAVNSIYGEYIDYDGFTFTFDSSSSGFTTDNQYVNYKLYDHLNVVSGTFNDSFDLGSGFTMTGFTSGMTYLLDDSSYPQTTSEMYSPLKITPLDIDDLDYFNKYTCVYINNNYDNKVFILDKDEESITIEKPSGETVSQITSFYTLSGISDVLYDVYLNTGNTYYYKEDEFRSKIYKAYNELLSVDNRIIQYTTGTIISDIGNKYVLKLFNYRNNENTSLTGNTISGYNDIFYQNDYNLTFKPLEIIEIGIDKHGKLPVRITDSDIVINDTIVSGYTVDIVKDNLISNITLVNGLTLEKLKIKYMWIFNAIIENAIIGEDDYGLVWYSGDWVCGEWVDGTWYSGNWYNGVWEMGNWYSWRIDKYQLLSNNVLKKTDDNKEYSKFINGEWETGYWYNGTFGDDISITGYTSKVFGNHNSILPQLNVATWKYGNFYNGEFKNSIWENGYFINGMMHGGYWKDGIFNDGTFNGNWWNGKFYGGDFVSGIWENGSLSNSQGISRFGYNILQSSATTTEWWDGVSNEGEFYSGINDVVNHNRTHWYNGVFRNSKWIGGHFRDGVFINSNFYNGIFGTESTSPNFTGNFINGLWLNGIFNDGNFINGLWVKGTFENGNMRTE